jgi:hypothetical protein
VADAFCRVNLILLLKVYVILYLEVLLPLNTINKTVVMPSDIKITVYLISFNTSFAAASLYL